MLTIFQFKPKNFYVVLFLFVFVCAITSCVSPGTQAATQVITAQTPIAVVTSQQQDTTVVAKETPTIVPISTSTMTPMITLSPMTTSFPATATPTMTPAPTLSIQDEGVLLAELMTHNGGCEIPCWWGVIPGKTSDQGARDMFASQGIDDWISAFNGTYKLMDLGYPHEGSPYYSSDVRLQLWVEDGFIQFIDITGVRRLGESGYLFTRDWQQYSLSEILNLFGVPSYVTLTPEISADPGPHYYNLGISYPSLGIEIHYIIAPLTLNNGKEQICADFEYVNSIRFILFPPERAADPLVDIIADNLDVYMSWEAVTGNNLEDFYNTFKNTNEPACVEIEPNTF